MLATYYANENTYDTNRTIGTTAYDFYLYLCLHILSFCGKNCVWFLRNNWLNNIIDFLNKIIYFPSQSTCSIHLLHPVHPSLHIIQPAAPIRQHPWIAFRQQDQDLTQQTKQLQQSLLHLAQHFLQLFSASTASRTISCLMTASFSFCCSDIMVYYNSIN